MIKQIAASLLLTTLLVSCSSQESTRLERLEDYNQRKAILVERMQEDAEALKKVEACIAGNSQTGVLMDCELAIPETKVSLIPKAEAIEIAPFDPSETLRKITTFRPNGEDPENCGTFKMGKVRKIELHYTATPYDTTVQSIYNAHKQRFGVNYYIAYHYLIKADGSIVNTRPETCGAIADKAKNNNLENIHIAFIGDDKPTDAQTRSLVTLTRKLQNHYWLDIPDVTSHAHEDAKSYKENTKYWYGSHEKFLELLRERDQKILFRGKENKLVQFAYNISGGDMDFLATVAQEAGWDINALWDKKKLDRALSVS